MTKTEYRAYTNSQRWKDLRKRHLVCNANCGECGMPRWLAEIVYDQDLHVHHVSYARLGTKDEWRDLQTLCRRCHEVETFGHSGLRAPKQYSCCICDQAHWNPRTPYCAECSLLFEFRIFGRYLSRVEYAGMQMWRHVLCTIANDVTGVTTDEIRAELDAMDELNNERQEQLGEDELDRDLLRADQRADEEQELLHGSD